MPLQLRQAERAVLGGQEFFRLFQELESGGDIYEVNTSIKAMVVGPQSDLANYSVNFFDAQSANNIDEMNLSIEKPIIGRVDSLLATTYPGTGGLPAQILVSPRDIVNNDFVPSTFSTLNGDAVYSRVQPQIDIISYLSSTPDVIPERDDRLYSFPFVAGLGTPAQSFYILPYYGRRYAEFSFHNLYGVAIPPAVDVTYTINILGINLFPGIQQANGVTLNGARAVETELAVGVVCGPDDQSNLVFTAEDDGMFDLISIAISSDNFLADLDSVMQLLVSDRVR